jgi:pimeloyl-ACP methyl ester carboxylesterase
VIHGVKRDADRYYETVDELLSHNPARARDTLILAPRYSGSIDSGFGGMAAWRKASWEDGEDSVQAAGRPAPVSSFQVLDDLLRSLDDRKRLPGLAGIVLAGHSAGAQLVQRYAVLNNVDGPLRRDGLALRYVVANPSSYLYLTNERPRADGKGYAPYERGICPTYNQYKYGTDKLPPYARETEESRLFVRYADRDVTYLLGGADNNPEHRLLDKTCGAEAQGATRLARGMGYAQYEYVLAARGAKPVPLHRRAYEVMGVGHDNKGMFGSVCGARALLGDNAQAADGAAPCAAIEPRAK